MPQTCVFRRIPQSGSELRKKRRQAMFSNELNRLIELFDKEKKKSSRNVWIVKPDEGHCGEDIELFDDIKSLEDYVRDMTQKCGAVVQKYVERLKYSGRKSKVRYSCLGMCYLRLSSRSVS